MLYLLNSAVVTAPGRYEYKYLHRPDAEDLAREGFTSAIGYEQTAEALEQILGQPVSVNRVMVQMEPGDRAIVFRLVFPPGFPRIDPADKGRLKQVVMDGFYELGLLTRLA